MSYLASNPWAKEARDLSPDPTTGASITRLSGSSIRTHNIYCDAPRATADGHRFASLRFMDSFLSETQALLATDLRTKLTCLIDREVSGWPIGPAWGGSVYYPRGAQLMRASLDTCQTEPVLDMTKLPRCWQLMSVTPDEQFLLYTAVVQDSPEAYNLASVNLRDGSWNLLLEKPTAERLGGAYNPATGNEILIAATFWEGKNRYGAGLLADAMGRNARQVFNRVHHAVWMGDGNRFAGLLAFDGDNLAHLPENPDGELMIYSKDGSSPRLIPAREHIFYHISSSRCGRYVVCESLEGREGPSPIVVTNVVTGRHRVLVSDCKCSLAGDDSRQAKPYFTADNRHVIYTADPDGVVNVYAAEIPQGFLESLK
ncbi:MAG: hypothetical protein HY360_14260 [Verrucomicrobia bacterium]|nr:hypothetical protein [Verrucomicrobiota bacterium]